VLAAAGVGVALAAWNNLVHLPAVVGRWPFVPLNVTFAAALVALARWCGLGWGDIGLGRRGTGRAAAEGAAVAGAAALGLGAALASPRLRPAVADGRFRDRTAGEVAWHALGRVPLGTALLEEVAFRGVYLALLRAVLGRRWAVAGSSAVFGLWHVRPGWATVRANGLAGGRGPAPALAATVVGTGLAGVAFCWLGSRHDNLAAPLVAHAGTNAAGTVAAHLANRWS
jgi:membrane protease YdiL (CAAX protease family)